MSRVTLHRIETGAASVTVGALMHVLDALDLPLGKLEDPEDADAGASTATGAETIELAAYPLLPQLAWHVQGTGTLSPAQAAGSGAAAPARAPADRRAGSHHPGS
jgi:transcriptional regulator with XRE-family HTH domain